MGPAKKPVKCKNGMVIGGGTVYPEVNLTLPTMLINEETMPKVLSQYEEMIHGICSKALSTARGSSVFFARPSRASGGT